jgi:hypothetical protein
VAKLKERKTRQNQERENEPESVSEVPVKTESIPKLTLPLVEDGSGIDWERVRPSNKNKFTSLIANDPVARAVLVPVGVDGKPEVDTFGGITEANVRVALDIVSQAESLVFGIAFAKIKKHPFKKLPSTNTPAPFLIEPDILTAAFTLTEEQHTEIDPRALRIAQKYGKGMPDWLQKNLDVYMLIGMYLKFTAANAANAIKSQILRDVAVAQEVLRKRAQVAPASPVETDKPKPEATNGKASRVISESFEPGHVPFDEPLGYKEPKDAP